MMILRRTALLALVSLALVAKESTSFAETPRSRSVARYAVPDVTLTDQDGNRVRLRDVVDPSKPLLLQFIFTSCSTICPLMGATFANFQRRLGDESKDVRLVSISIDPDHDTPARMKAFLQKLDARPSWTFLTGSRQDIRQVTAAFEALSDDKSQHSPLTFFSSPADGSWVRLVGLVPASELVEEHRKVHKK
jgi:protein SCO1/2